MVTRGVPGASDGIASTATLVVGVAAAQATSQNLLVAGSSLIFLAICGGERLGSRAVQVQQEVICVSGFEGAVAMA